MSLDCTALDHSGYNVKIICGNAHMQLAQEVGKLLGTNVAPTSCKRFADGECGVQVLENVRGCDCFIVQPTCPPVNDHLMEVLLITDALRRASAKRITAVIPYFGYARQDRKVKSRVPISAALVAQLLEAAGVHRILAVDLHRGQIAGFFRIPVDNLLSAPLLCTRFVSLDLINPMVVSTDVGGAERADKFREGLKKESISAGMAMISKTSKDGAMELVGSVEDSDVIIIGDIIDTAGTLCAAAGVLKAHGARRVFAAASHGIFSSDALARIEASNIDLVVVTDTIPQKASAKVETVSVATVLSEAIKRIHTEESVSSIFV